ncbi:MAG TPA: hypothetical protein VGO09_08945 [Flavisolibacter sp.]|nr:hypothetical protein [Flavisolibacter sp.]
MAHGVLREDWSDYDNKKIRDNRDRSYFACEEKWEVDYLVNKLNKHYPYKTTEAVRAAITSCCSELKTPRTRQAFVECVTKKLA